MAEFALQEFEEFFRTMAIRYRIRNSRRYLNSIANDYENYFRLKDSSGLTLPEKFVGRELEYFILYHFARYFLDGVGYNIKINETFLKSEKIRSIELQPGDVPLYSLEISSTISDRLKKDRDELNELFKELIINFLGENFSVNDFVKTN